MSSDNEATSLAKEVAAPAHNGDKTASPTSKESAPSVGESAAIPPAMEVPPPAQGEDEPQPAPSPADSRSEEGEARSNDSPEAAEKKAGEGHTDTASDAPPLPNEPTPGGGGDAPPLPAEAPPGQAAGAAAAAASASASDDGWTALWDAANQTWYFYNSLTGHSQWENPRLAGAAAGAAAAAAPGSAAAAAQSAAAPGVAGGYNPAIHGSWDPTAAYAQAYAAPGADADEAEYQADLAMYHAEMDAAGPTAAAEGFGLGGEYGAAAAFNRRTGKPQAGDQNPERYSDASKSYRQMNAYFNVDQAANSHDGRSLKAERRGKQPTKKELSAWKEKRKARKEEKRRAWLRD